MLCNYTLLNTWHVHYLNNLQNKSKRHQLVSIKVSPVTIEFCSFSGSGSLLSVSSASSSSLSPKAGIIFDLISELETCGMKCNLCSLHYLMSVDSDCEVQTCKHADTLILTVAQRGHCSVGWGGRKKPPTGHRNQRTEPECAAHPTAPAATQHRHACIRYKKRRGEELNLSVCLVLYEINFYLERPETETVEQRESNQTAKDAVDCRDETRSSWNKQYYTVRNKAEHLSGVRFAIT